MRCSSRPLYVAAGFLLALLTGCTAHGGVTPGIPGSDTSQATPAGGALSMERATQRMYGLMKDGRAGSDVTHGGAGYPVTPTPRVKVPNETPCVDVLFTPHTPPLNSGGLPVGDFADYNDHPFNYTPPANCPGPYAKIVLKVHFNVTAGIQYDRTGAIWVGATNIFFGTTAEPSPNASPNWEVERDVSEYAPIFAQASTGQASVYNIVNSSYTGIIHGTAELDFYPATSQYPAAKAADAVYPLSGGADGGYVDLDGPSNLMSGTFTFPTNVEAAYLDVFLESQGGDEFWYTCFPNNLAQEYDNCGNTGFREGEVTVDGQPAGVVPVYPWIYTGGIDPYLWIPIPGVETLNFVPYRIDLTPFAAQLDDGNPHTIAVAVYNDDNYFATNAALLVYQDQGSTQVTGQLVSDGTASAPDEKVAEHVKSTPSGGAYGTIDVSAIHPVSLDGYVMTSHGRVDTSVHQTIRFSNVQQIRLSSSQFLQNITQATTVASVTTTKTHGHLVTARSQRSWPFLVKYDYVVGSSSAVQTTDVKQTKNENGTISGLDGGLPWSLLNTMHSSDTLTFTSTGYTPSNGKSRQQYQSKNLGGIPCYNEIMTSLNYVLTGTTKKC
jgi:hypothetical protein